MSAPGERGDVSPATWNAMETRSVTTGVPARRLTWIRYGASELKRDYQKNMTIGLGVSIVLNLVFVSGLWLLFPQEPEAVSHRTIRIRRYADLDLPPPVRMREFGLSANPVLPSTPFSADQPAAMPVIRSVPFPARPGQSAGTIMRPEPGDLGGLPTPEATDKLRAEEGGREVHEFDGRSPKAMRDDVAGGGGASDAWRAGGRPVPAKRGDSPSGQDRSGVGSSAKPSAGTIPYGLGSGSGGGGNGEGGDGFAVQWLQGNVRRKLAGDLPKYPPGTNVEAQVRIKTVVLPDGTVRSVQPAQKGDNVLENAAMREVKFWRFEPLPAGVPQVEQTCIVSFLFKLH